MELRQLRYFMQIYKDGSFSKAANKLYISQQGLSKSIAALEQELGVMLLYRDKRTIVLTEAGEYLKEQASIILHEVEKTEKMMKTFVGNGLIKLACGYAIMGELPEHLLNKWKSQNPQLVLEDYEYPDLTVEDMVIKEEVDIGLTIGPVDEELFEAHFLKRRKLCLLVNNRNPLSKRSALSCKDLQGQQIISVGRMFRTYSNFMDRCKREEVEPNIIFLGMEIANIHNMSRQGKGIGVTVDFIAASLPSAEYKCIPFTGDDMNWDVYLITKRGKKHSLHVQNFKQYVLVTCKG